MVEIWVFKRFPGEGVAMLACSKYDIEECRASSQAVVSSTYAIQVDYHGYHCVDRIGSRGVFEPKEAQHMLSLTNSELVCGAQRLKEGSKYSLDTWRLLA